MAALERLSAAAARAVDEYYERCRLAELNRADKTQAALTLQSCWRGCLQRNELKKLSHVALTIQRCWRGYLGRQRFAAARATKNKQLREIYFAQQATTIQKWWRGYFSRSRIHNFYKRKAYLAAVAATNTAVRAAMAAGLQEALTQQQQQAEQQAKQHFDAQVSRLHHLASTACSPGIFSPPAAATATAREVPTVAGLPLEHHLRTASKQQAAGAVKRQQHALRHTVGSSSRGTFSFPAGPIASLINSGTGAAAPAAVVSAAAAAAVAGRVGSPGSAVSAAASTVAAHSSGSCNATLRGMQGGAKLSSMVVASVDEAFAARAEPNMPDGRFNPVLSLQQSAECNALRDAGELERRINRGLMLNIHGGQPFTTGTKLAQYLQADSPCGAATGTQHSNRREKTITHSHAALAGSCSPGTLSAADGPSATGWQAGAEAAESRDSPQRHWQHNQFSGGMFSKHLKQAY